MTKPKNEPQQPDTQPRFDDVLKRMLASPPAPHVKKKPAAKAAAKKPAK